MASARVPVVGIAQTFGVPATAKVTGVPAHVLVAVRGIGVPAHVPVAVKGTGAPAHVLMATAVPSVKATVVPRAAKATSATISKPILL